MLLNYWVPRNLVSNDANQTYLNYLCSILSLSLKQIQALTIIIHYYKLYSTVKILSDIFVITLSVLKDFNVSESDLDSKSCGDNAVRCIHSLSKKAYMVSLFCEMKVRKKLFQLCMMAVQHHSVN